MARRNVKRTWEAPLNVDLPVELRQELDDFCIQRKVKIKQVVEAALRRFMNAEEGKRK